MAAGRIGGILRIAAVVLPAAFFFSICSDLPQVFLLTGALLVADAAWRRPFPPTDRSFIYSAVVVGVLTLLGNYLLPLKSGRLGFLSIFVHPELLVPALLYTAALAANFRSNRWAPGLAGAAALAALAFGSDVRTGRGTPAPERWIGSEALMNAFPWFYAATTGIVLLLFLTACRAWIGPGRGGRTRTVLTAAAFLAVPVVGGGLYGLYKAHERGVRQFELLLLRTGFRASARWSDNRTVFGKEVSLNATLDPGLRKQERRIAFRATSPGYLRGRVFTVYARGVWSNPPGDEPLALAGTAADGFKSDRRFVLDANGPPDRFEMEILPEPALRTDILFYPGNVRVLELIGDRLRITPDGQIEVSEFQRDGGFTARFERPEEMAASQRSAAPEGAVYTAYPPELENALRTFDRAAASESPRDDAALFAAFQRRFFESYRYSLNFQPDGGDPVERFLLRDRAGHCELFASALALALRRRGVPTRYVTGFVCTERHPVAPYFLARLGDAHAWVEAYDRQLRRWVALDPTPPVPRAQPVWSDRARLWSDWFAWIGKRLLGDLRRGRYAEAIAHAASAVGSAVRRWFADPYRAAGTLALAAALLWGPLRRRMRRRTRASRAEVTALLRRYCRRRRIPPAGAQELLERYPDDPFLRKYQRIRFRAAAPAPAEIEELKRLIGECEYGS